MHYHTGTGTDGVDGGGNVHIYLDDAFGNLGGKWDRFERNVALDWAAHGSGSFQYMDGVYFVNPLADKGGAYRMYVDLIRLSNSMTV